MNANNILIRMLIVTPVVLIAGCDKKPVVLPLPEVNNENCAVAKIKEMSPKERQQEFADLCALRGTFVPSKPRSW